MPIGKARLENLNQASISTNLKIMADTEVETCLADVIGNSVAEEITREKALKVIEKLGGKWNKENVGIHGW